MFSYLTYLFIIYNFSREITMKVRVVNLLIADEILMHRFLTLCFVVFSL